MGGVDFFLFRCINGASDSVKSVMLFFSIATNLPWVKVVLLIWIASMLWRGKSYRVTILITVAAAGLANLMTDLAKRAFPMLRPFKDPAFAEEVILRIGRKTDVVGFGTMSAHSANTAAVATALWLGLGWRWGLPAAVISLLTGVSRVYNGVHYPSQVAMGWLAGILSATIITLTARFFLARLAPVPQPDVTPTVPESS